MEVFVLEKKQKGVSTTYSYFDIGIMHFPGKEFLVNSRIYWSYKWIKAWFAHYWCGKPSRRMVVIGVTGTDGKTTTCNMIHWIFQHSLGKTMYVGTTGVLIGDEEVTGIQKMTSYDPMSLQALLARGYHAGCKYAILEVSSHGLHQLRFAGIKFALGVLTNITPEHLDYHGTYENYQEAKKLLFDYVATSSAGKGSIVLPSHQTDIEHWKKEFLPYTTTYGLGGDEDIYASDITYGKDSSSATITLFGQQAQVDFPMVGKFNIYNMLAACSVGAYFEIPLDRLVDILAEFPGVVGRQQHVIYNDIDWYIDFAHTPEGLQSILEYLQTIKGSGRLWCLFGAPGMRDPYKRPEMGRVVDSLADIMIITDDDADQEDRNQIIEQIKAGVMRPLGSTYSVIPDRYEAISYVTQHAQPGDIVLLAGKGHETVLVTNNGKIPRSDLGVLEACLGIENSHEL